MKSLIHYAGAHPADPVNSHPLFTLWLIVASCLHDRGDYGPHPPPHLTPTPGPRGPFGPPGGKGRLRRPWLRSAGSKSSKGLPKRPQRRGARGEVNLPFDRVQHAARRVGGFEGIWHGPGKRTGPVRGVSKSDSGKASVYVDCFF